MSESSTLSQRSLLGIRGLTRADVDLIHATAREFKDVLNRPIKKVPSLRDFTVANLFFENSTRTRLSFELAEKRLSADVVNFSAAGSSVKKGETLVDTVNNILAMKVDMVVNDPKTPIVRNARVSMPTKPLYSEVYMIKARSKQPKKFTPRVPKGKVTNPL